MNHSALLSTQDAARRLGVSRQHVARLVTRGALTPAHKAPGSRGAYLFDPSEVERLAERRKAAA